MLICAYITNSGVISAVVRNAMDHIRPQLNLPLSGRHTILRCHGGSFGPLSTREMTTNDFLWVPVDSVVTWLWYWWLKQGSEQSKGVREHAWRVALVLLTLSAALFTYSAALAWVTGFFTLRGGLLNRFALGMLLNLGAFGSSTISYGKRRLFGVGTALLFSFCWVHYVFSMRSTL